MTREQELKIEFAYYMAIANSQIYPDEIRKNAQDEAIAIGFQLGLPLPTRAVESEAAKEFADNPFDLSGPATPSKPEESEASKAFLR